MAEAAPDLASLMTRALRLARRGQGDVEPNPMVGAVLARREGRGLVVVAEGWHARFGGPHAEVAALGAARAAGADPRGLTMAVTLEPCGHEGKTPPCVDALVEAGVGEVVVGTIDPNPAVRGKGVAALRAAGIAVEVGVCGEAAEALIAPFSKRIATGLPWVIAKWAQTIDGKTATRTGDSRWISNEASRRRVHRWRGEVDAVMVGVGTVAADDPELTARGEEPKRVARRVVVDPSLRLPGTAKLWTESGPPVTVLCGRDAERSLPPHVDRLDTGRLAAGRLDLAAALRELAARHDLTNVLVEGGPKLLGGLIDEGLVDELRVFVAPKLLGDPAARSAADGPAREAIADAAAWPLRHVERMGDDVLLVYRQAGAAGGARY